MPAAATVMNHSVRLCVYTLCEMSRHPARPTDVTIRARRRVISVVFKSGALWGPGIAWLTSRPLMSCWITARLLRKISLLAWRICTKAQSETRRLPEKEREKKKQAKTRSLAPDANRLPLCATQRITLKPKQVTGPLHMTFLFVSIDACGRDRALANIHLLTATVPYTDVMTTTQCQDQETLKN